MQTNISSNIEAALIKWGAGQPHPTGDFLRAVLTNDLFEAVARADMHNRATLAEIVNYVRWNLPPECYGSSQKYDAWISKARVESMIERSEERDDPAELEARSGTWTIDASEFARQMEHEAELEAAQLAALVRAVNMHARAHYNEGGWDVIVECWDDAEIAQLLVEDAITTEAEAIAAFVPLVEVWREQETDAEIDSHESSGEWTRELDDHPITVCQRCGSPAGTRCDCAPLTIDRAVEEMTGREIAAASDREVEIIDRAQLDEWEFERRMGLDV